MADAPEDRLHVLEALPGLFRHFFLAVPVAVQNKIEVPEQFGPVETKECREYKLDEGTDQSKAARVGDRADPLAQPAAAFGKLPMVVPAGRPFLMISQHKTLVP